MQNVHLASNFTVIIDTDIDLTTATTTDIIYRKPSSASEVTVAATVIDQTKLLIEIVAATNDTIGKWLFRPSFVIAGKTYSGDAHFVEVEGPWHPAEYL